MVGADFHVLTGGTSGMGLCVAQALAKLPNAHVIVGARNPDQAKALRRSVSSSRLTVLPLNLESLESVRRFVELVWQTIEGGCVSSIICNGGVQLSGDKVMATPKVEKTYMVNVLAHVLLVDLLLPGLKPGAHVVTVGSGTHNPDDKLAKMFGFRGASFPDANRVISGELGAAGNRQQLNMDRYATSKLGAIYQVMQLASECEPDKCSFYSFDPGLMPGTGLARERPAMERFGWKYVMPALRLIMSGVSTSRSSANALVQHCVLRPVHPSGSYVEFTGKLAPRSKLSENTGNARELIEKSRLILQSGH